MSLDLLLLVAMLVALAMVGSRVGFGQRRLPSGIMLLSETKTMFIVIGMAIGPHGFNLLSDPVLRQLKPILILGFGWIGFLYGSHLEWRRMRRFGSRLYGAGFCESLVTLLGVGGVCWLLLPLLQGELSSHTRLMMACALGICAAGTAPAGVFLLEKDRRIARSDVRVLKFFSAIDDLPAILALGGLFAVLHQHEGAAVLGAWQRLLLSVGMGLVLGGVSHWLFPTSGDVRHNTVILLGVAALTAGAADLLGLSPLFVAVVAGVAFANLSPRKESAYGLMASREQILYAVFLLIAGAMFGFERGRLLWLMVPGYALVRAAGKLLGALLGRVLFLPRSELSRGIGAGLLFQGGLPVVIAVHFEHAHGKTVALPLFMTIFVLGVVINDMVARRVAVAVLKREPGR